MNGYKAHTQLNEKDSLQDMLNIEKALVKMYSIAITEGNGKSFRTLIKSNMIETAGDQYEVFTQMSNHGYYQVKPADKAVIDEQKANFKEVKKELS